MVSNKCVVIRCVNAAKRKYTFPIIDVDFSIWVERTGNGKLLNLTKDEVRKSFQICRNHFDLDCDSPGTNQKLKFRSLPTLNLPRNVLCHKCFSVTSYMLLYCVLVSMCARLITIGKYGFLFVFAYKLICVNFYLIIQQ